MHIFCAAYKRITSLKNCNDKPDVNFGIQAAPQSSRFGWFGSLLERLRKSLGLRV